MVDAFVDVFGMRIIDRIENFEHTCSDGEMWILMLGIAEGRRQHYASGKERCAIQGKLLLGINQAWSLSTEIRMLHGDITERRFRHDVGLAFP